MSLSESIQQFRNIDEGSRGQARLRRKRRALSKQMAGKAGSKKDWESYWSLTNKGPYQGPAGGRTPTSTAARAAKDPNVSTKIGSPLYNKMQGAIRDWRQRTNRHGNDKTRGREFTGRRWSDRDYGPDDEKARAGFDARKQTHATQRGQKTKGRQKGDLKVIFGKRHVWDGQKWVPKKGGM